MRLLLLFAVAAFAQDARLRKELRSAYTRWVEQDVAWIISPDERAAFQKLQNDDEREQFVEQFWRRRDPTPDTVENEFREEHYRRIAYANQHFASGIPGWRADRGRIYIAWGPPDEREEHPSGGSDPSGTTTTFPYERWRYRHLEGVDTDVTLEFVDRTMSGEYRLTIDPCEKDALAHTRPSPCEPTGTDQFRRLELQARIFTPPPVRFHDLEAVVESNVSYHNLPLKVAVNYFPLTDASVLAYVSLQFENRDLQFAARDGVQRATVNVLGKVSTMSRRTVMPFEATVAVETPERLLDAFARNRSVYHTVLPLPPGTYRLDIAAKDVNGGATTHLEAALAVPRLDPDRLQLSSVVLTDPIGKDGKLRPRVDGRFTAGERPVVYARAYHVTAPATAHYEVRSAKGEVLFTASDPLKPGAEATIARALNLAALGPGEYTLELRVGEASAAVPLSVR